MHKFNLILQLPGNNTGIEWICDSVHAFPCIPFFKLKQLLQFKNHTSYSD